VLFHPTEPYYLASGSYDREVHLLDCRSSSQIAAYQLPDEIECMVRLTYLLTHSLAHSLTHSLTYLRTHSLTHLLTHSLTHTLTYALIHSLGVGSIPVVPLIHEYWKWFGNNYWCAQHFIQFTYISSSWYNGYFTVILSRYTWYACYCIHWSDY